MTRAFIHHLAAKETVGAHLLTMHNIYYLLDLMSKANKAIVEDRYPIFVADFFSRLYSSKTDYPQWAVDALRTVGVDLLA